MPGPHYDATKTSFYKRGYLHGCIGLASMAAKEPALFCHEQYELGYNDGQDSRSDNENV